MYTRTKFWILAVVLALLALPLAAEGVKVRATTIASGASLSGPVASDDGAPVVLVIPGAWTPASVTFQCSADNAAYADLYDQFGTEYTVTAAASRAIILPAADFAGCRSIKVRSGTSAAPVAQAAARALTLVLRGM